MLSPSKPGGKSWWGIARFTRSPVPSAKRVVMTADTKSSLEKTFGSRRSFLTFSKLDVGKKQDRIASKRVLKVYCSQKYASWKCEKEKCYNNLPSFSTATTRTEKRSCPFVFYTEDTKTCVIITESFRQGFSFRECCSKTIIFRGKIWQNMLKIVFCYGEKKIIVVGKHCCSATHWLLQQ